MYKSAHSYYPRHLVEVSGHLHGSATLPLGKKAPGFH
jgi:hypothetical protein